MWVLIFSLKTFLFAFQTLRGGGEGGRQGIFGLPRPAPGLNSKDVARLPTTEGCRLYDLTFIQGLEVLKLQLWNLYEFFEVVI